jgi:hypothetical protein
MRHRRHREPDRRPPDVRRLLLDDPVAEQQSDDFDPQLPGGQ